MAVVVKDGIRVNAKDAVDVVIGAVQTKMPIADTDAWAKAQADEARAELQAELDAKRAEFDAEIAQRRKDAEAEIEQLRVDAAAAASTPPAQEAPDATTKVVEPEVTKVIEPEVTKTRGARTAATK